MKMKVLKPLYTVDSKGQIRVWKVRYGETPDGTGRVERTHGVLDGKVQTNIRFVRKGKNIGRSNETTPLQQAASEARSLWNARKDDGYVDYMPDPSNPPQIWLPMKAQRYKNRMNKVTFPCYLQPKINGVRAMAEIIDQKAVIFHSGGNKTYDVLHHLVEPLTTQFRPGRIPDGEIYRHGWPLSKIVSRAKKFHPDTCELQLWVFDLIDGEQDFSNRWKTLKTLLQNPAPIVKVPTRIVRSHLEIEKLQEMYLEKGFEGTIIRSLHGIYRMNYRSPEVLKYPGMEREEFKIVDVKEGQGLDAGCAIFVCETRDGTPFEVRPMGTVGERQRYLREFSKIEGKMLTVKFKEYTAYGKPHCPIGEVIRDYE